MRIIRKRMEQKKGKVLSSNGKPKTPHARKTHKQQIDTKVVRRITEDLIGPPGFDLTAPSNIFGAIETGNFEAVRKFVEIATDPAVINSKGLLYLTPLELAVLLHNRQITKFLLQNGGTESDQCEVVIERLKEEIHNNLNDNNFKENAVWESRRRNIRRIILGWDQLKRPDKPKLFVEPTSKDSVMVEIGVRETSSIITKLRVQWSSSPIFDVFNERIIAANPQNLKFIIPKLDPSVRYFFRAYAGNIKDWSVLSSFSLCCASWRKTPEKQDLTRAELNCLYAQFQSLCDLDAPKEEKVGKKKGIHLLFNTVSIKFLKTLKRGIYLSFIFYNRERNVFLAEDSCPLVEVCDSTSSLSPGDFFWLLKISRSWFNLRSLRIRDRDSWDMRRKLVQALKNVQNELGIVDLGTLYHRETVMDDATVLIFIKSEESTPTILSGKWTATEKIRKQHFLPPQTVEDMIRSHETTNCPLPRGLYLVYLSTKTSVNSIFVLASKNSMLPHAKIRDNPYVCGEEWEVFQENKVSGKSYLTELQLKFLLDLQHAATDLIKQGHENLSDLRFYTNEVVEVNEYISLIVVLPKPEKFCEVVSDDSTLRHGRFLPLKTFELLNLSAYQPQMARKHFELSCTLELELHLAAQQSREAFSTDEIESSKQRLRQLQEIADSCKGLWKRLNWLNALIQFAQDKKVVGNQEPTLRNVLEFRRGGESLERTPPKIKVRHQHKTSPKHFHNHSYTTSTMDGSSVIAKKVEDLRANVQNVKLLEAPPPETSILQVFAAYDTGLPSGTSLKLRVTPKTTAREVIDLVIKQLNMAVVLKGKEGPIYSADELQNFCLVAIIGSRERSLRDDFRPLQLQNPWKKGALYVRQKHDLLAAIEHSGHQTTI